MIDRMFSGSRCRIVRAVPCASGPIHRHTHGTIRYAMHNLGRDLLLVDWDTGQASLVFPTDIELMAPAPEVAL